MYVLPRQQTSSAPPRCKVPILTHFDDCDVIVCYGGAKATDKHVASTVHCVDDEIIEWLKRLSNAGAIATPRSN